MDKRKTARLSLNEVPVLLQKPILLYNYEEVESKIENLSPLGIGLSIERNSLIREGDFFYLKYYDIDSYIKCVCVFTEDNEDKKSIGAYFTDPEDKKIISKLLKLHESD